jgi:hypothetical protein
MLDPEFGLSSDRNLLIIHFENPKKAPRISTVADAKAAIISEFIVNIHLFYTRGRLTLEESMETLNLLPPSLEWVVYRNDTTELTILLVDENDAALDLTDWDFTGKVREYPSDATVLVTLTITKVDNALTVVLDNSDLPITSYFDIEGINSDNAKVSTVVRGRIQVEEDVTR